MQTRFQKSIQTQVPYAKEKKKEKKKKKNSWDILGQNFVKYMFVTITLSKNKVPSSFQEFSSCKNSSFCKV